VVKPEWIEAMNWCEFPDDMPRFEPNSPKVPEFHIEYLQAVYESLNVPFFYLLRLPPEKWLWEVLKVRYRNRLLGISYCDSD